MLFNKQFAVKLTFAEPEFWVAIAKSFCFSFSFLPGFGDVETPLTECSRRENGEQVGKDELRVGVGRELF